MSEGPEVERAIIRRVWPETERLTGVVLEVSEEAARRYRRPGQIVVLRPPSGKRVYLVITSAPGEARALELLLGEQAVRDVAPSEGAEVDLERPSGPGFPLELAKGSDVLLFGIGSAIAALRPLVEVIRRHRDDYGRVTAYLGTHTEQDLPYRGDQEGWRRDRIDVVRAISKPWVQDLFERDPVPVAGAFAFIAGTKVMMQDVEARLVKAGMPADRVKRNW